jgi:16S rRNA processing protein RimM
MVDLKDLLPVGVLTRTHGFEGELTLRLQDLEADDIPEMEWVFVEIDGLPVPFFVSHTRRQQDNKIILQLETVTTEVLARKLTGCRLYIQAAAHRRKKMRTTGPADIRGYRVTDENLGEIGIADEIIAVAGNPLLKIVSGNKELLIPAHPDIILEISHTKKHIRIQAPEGLIES